ncbi:CoA-transferase [Nocardia sp. NPDC005978]|uniref:CoA-transferase n=1 Tax=Nocardia sp. NPDC005978 TaxID=3156725 RepID=UPI0033BB0850
MSSIVDWVDCGVQLVRWLPTWKRYDRDHRPEGMAPVFVSARRAAAMIEDGAVVAGAGLGAHGRASTLYFAIRDQFAETGHPAGLTWIHCGGGGGRGKLPGTLDDLTAPGLLAQVITGHTQTMPGLRDRAAAGDLEMHVFPQGVLSRLIEGQADGVRTLSSPIGVGTFVDTRVGAGTVLCADSGPSMSSPNGEMIDYRLPQIDTAVFFAPWADAHGNIYFDGANCLTEMDDIARAARAGGGQVLVMVAGILDDEQIAGAPALTVDQVDAIVVSRHAEQVASLPQTRQRSDFLPGADGDRDRILQRTAVLDRLMGAAPVRGDADRAVARLAAELIGENTAGGDWVNIGTGLPEEVASVMHTDAEDGRFQFCLETGVLGGTPVPGGLFGVAIGPQELHSSAWMFRHFATELSAACLGMLEFDVAGNVNVSRTGPGVEHSIGPGGFIDIADAAPTVVFVGSWRRGAQARVTGDGQLRLSDGGSAKLVSRVREITFDGPSAYRRGKTVYYVTQVGAFRLGEHGVVLTHLMPGIDIDRDIRSVMPDIAVVEGGPVRVGTEITTGAGFNVR